MYVQLIYNSRLYTVYTTCMCILCTVYCVDLLSVNKGDIYSFGGGFFFRIHVDGFFIFIQCNSLLKLMNSKCCCFGSVAACY